MKKIILFLSVIVLMTSCSKSEEQPVTAPPSNNVAYGSLIKTMDYGGGGVESYEYNGNKLFKITDISDNEYEKYIYTGNLITQIETYNYTTNSLKQTETLGYDSNNRLNNYYSTQYAPTPSSNFLNKNIYTYNTDGTISYVNYSGSGTTLNPIANYNGVIKLTNGEVIENTVTFVSNGAITKKTFSYDTKNSPLKNVLSFDKLVFTHDYAKYGWSNNVMSFTVAGSIPMAYNSTYTYNTDNYPLTCREVSGNGSITNIIYTYY